MGHYLDDLSPNNNQRTSTAERFLMTLLGTSDFAPFARALRDQSRVSDQSLADWASEHALLFPCSRETFRIYRKSSRFAKWCSDNEIDIQSL